MKRSHTTHLPAASAGTNGGAHMVVTRGREKDRLGLGTERLGDAGQDNMADDLGAGRTARLTRQQKIDAQRLELLRQRRRMRRFSRALAAFECDEFSAHLIPRIACFGSWCLRVAGERQKPIIAVARRRGTGRSPIRPRHPGRVATATLVWTGSAALSGMSRITLSLRQTRSEADGAPCSTGAGTGPV